MCNNQMLAQTHGQQASIRSVPLQQDIMVNPIPSGSIANLDPYPSGHSPGPLLKTANHLDTCPKALTVGIRHNDYDVVHEAKEAKEATLFATRLVVVLWQAMYFSTKVGATRSGLLPNISLMLHPSWRGSPCPPPRPPLPRSCLSGWSFPYHQRGPITSSQKV